MSDLTLQRQNMVESQVRPSDVTDRRIPRARTAVPREACVSAARRSLASLGADNVAIVQGDLPTGYPAEGPFDAIVLEGAVSAVPEALLGQLKDGGRLVAIVSDGRTGRAAVWQRSGSTVSERDGFDAGAPFLPGFEPVQRFTFG